jgi:diacylglycerol kinase (ATP)
MKLPLVFNPRSGPKGKNPDALMARLPAEVRDRIEPKPFGPPWDFEPLIRQAREAEGPLLVWGGDGTIHHAGKALVQAGCPVALAAIPGGSGNGLVRGLRTPNHPAKAVVALLEGRELVMDLPRLDGVPFLNVCGTGFEAAIAHAFDHLDGRGFWNYTRLFFRMWRSHHLFELDMDGVEGEPPDMAWSVCFANLPQYGSGIWIAPNADPTDGALQWVTLKRPHTVDLCFRALPLFQRQGRTSLRKEGRLARTILRLERSMPWQMDGEPVAARDTAELTLEPKAFRMQVTKGCPWG